MPTERADTREIDYVHWRHISSCFPAICGSASENCVYESYSAITCPDCLRLRQEWKQKLRNDKGDPKCPNK